MAFHGVSELRDDARSVTVLRRRRPFFGIALLALAVVAMLGLDVVSWPIGVVVLAAFALIGAGHGQRVVVTPLGVAVSTTWYGIALSTQRFGLDVDIGEYEAFEDVEPQGVAVGPACFVVPVSAIPTVRVQIEEAVARASGGVLVRRRRYRTRG